MKKINRKEQKVMITMTILVLAVLFLLQSFSKPQEINFSYQITHRTDYQVYLEKNDFIIAEFMPKDKVYLQNLVRYIAVSFTYDYLASQKENLESQYDIKTTLYINYANTNQNLLKKEYPIIENKFLKKENEKQMEIKENIKLDYQTYYQEVQRFKEQFNLPIKAYLKVNFLVNTRSFFIRKNNKNVYF